MVSLCLPSLSDLCSIRLGYLLCIRRLVGNYEHSMDDFFNENEVAALAAAEGLPLPERLKCLVVQHVKPTGGRLISFLNLWHSKLPFDGTLKWRINYLLFDCLVLNAYGLIDQRRTAQTLLSNTEVGYEPLHYILAFRLACINFLETEVLKLWIIAREYILTKIVIKGHKPRSFQGAILGAGPIPEEDIEACYSRISESEEVLFWTAYCLSREKGVDLREVPHFMGGERDWYEIAVRWATFQGNVACLEYFKSLRDGRYEFNPVRLIERRLRRSQEKLQQSPFIFHFNLLSIEQKSRLFREHSKGMVNQFLQWPLSQTFFLNTEEIWNLIPERRKHWLLLEVHNILIFENAVWHKTDIIHPNLDFTYCVEHVTAIWHALWKASPDNHKSTFLDLRIFPDFQGFDGDESPSRFETSGLKQKLLSLCLSNSRAVMELYQTERLQESLRSVIAKYMPEDLQDLERGFLSFFEPLSMPLTMFTKNRGEIMALEATDCHTVKVYGRYLYYIKAVEFSLDRS